MALETLIEELIEALHRNTDAMVTLNESVAVNMVIPRVAPQAAPAASKPADTVVGNPAPVAEKRGRGRPPKDAASKPVEKVDPHSEKQAAAAADLADQGGAQDENGDTPTATYDDLTDAIMKLAQKKGQAHAKALLARYGVNHGKLLKPEQYAEVIRDATADLDENADAGLV